MAYFSITSDVRQPAVAGLFYPENPGPLRALIQRLQANSQIDVRLPTPPKALIVPHAGYPYSGAVAAAGFGLLKTLRETVTRVVLIGPIHRLYLRGIALPQARVFATPLGEISIDDEGRNRLVKRGDVLASDTPHAMEHCLEVQLPFLQAMLRDFSLLPLIVGSTTAEHVAAVLSEVWGDEETVILASSDLSHYLTYESAQRLDKVTAAAIGNRQTDLTQQQACGAAAINGLLLVAKERGLEVTEIARLNSGDTSGDVERVVGYGAFALHEPRRRTAQ